MNGSDRNKLIKAGFRVMRACKLNKTITELGCTGGWTLISRHKTHSELRRAVKDLRVDEKVIFETEE